MFSASVMFAAVVGALVAEVDVDVEVVPATFEPVAELAADCTSDPETTVVPAWPVMEIVEKSGRGSPETSMRRTRRGMNSMLKEGRHRGDQKTKDDGKRVAVARDWGRRRSMSGEDKRSFGF